MYSLHFMHGRSCSTIDLRIPTRSEGESHVKEKSATGEHILLENSKAKSGYGGGGVMFMSRKTRPQANMLP